VVVVDNSAIVAILFGEAERDRYRAFLDRSMVAMYAGSIVGTTQVALRHAPQRYAEARLLLETCGVEIVPVDAAEIGSAEKGALRFGTGRGAPPAVLSFGDLFACALARHLDASLLFTGDEFSKTDAKVALAG
jgi:ribonuclease VapC